MNCFDRESWSEQGLFAVENPWVEVNNSCYMRGKATIGSVPPVSTSTYSSLRILPKTGNTTAIPIYYLSAEIL